MNLEDVEAGLSEPTNFIPSWCKRRCNLLMNKKIVNLGLLILIIVAPIIIYVTWPSNNSEENAIIYDPEFQNLAAFYTKSLDQNSQPCEDFYAFACNNLRREFRKAGENRFDTLNMIRQHVLAYLDDLLIKPANTSDSETLRQLKIFQQMCRNNIKVEAEGIEPVLTVLNEIGGWPLLTNDSKNNESWENIVGSVNRAGFATFFPYFMVFEGNSNNSFKIVLQPFIDISRPRSLMPELKTVNYVKRIALLLNATNDQITQDIVNCITFETKLEELTYSIVPDEEEHTLQSLLVTYPEIPWQSFFRNVFISTGIQVSSNESVVLSHSEYNVKVSKLLNETSAKTIRNYLIWRVIVGAIPVMPEKFRRVQNIFEQQTVVQSRNLDCVQVLIDRATFSVGYLYVTHLFDGRAKNMSYDLIENLKLQAYHFLKNANWVDDVTKLKVIETLVQLKIQILLPEESLNINVMETLEFQSNDTVFENYRRLAKAHRNFDYGRLRMSQEVDQQLSPLEYSLIANAWYSPILKTAFILPALFQHPFFSASQPMYLNYGGIGFMIAHEMTHGLEILSFCENETCPSFNRFQDCIGKLYDGYVMKHPNVTINATLTMEENIGDLIALKLSYRAYEEFAKGSEEQLLPGLNYTARQWFWINAATVYCGYESDASARINVLTDPHSPHEARINVAFANSEEFSRDFACPVGSHMNPVRKCAFEQEKPSVHSESFPHGEL